VGVEHNGQKKSLTIPGDRRVGVWGKNAPGLTHLWRVEESNRLPEIRRVQAGCKKTGARVSRGKGGHLRKGGAGGKARRDSSEETGVVELSSSQDTPNCSTARAQENWRSAGRGARVKGRRGGMKRFGASPEPLCGIRSARNDFQRTRVYVRKTGVRPSP